MRTVCSTESIIDIDITELGKRVSKPLDTLLISLDFLAVLFALALLFDVEAEVFEENHRALGCCLTRPLYLGAHTVLQESHFPTERFLDGGHNLLQRELALHLTVGSTHMRHEHYRVCACVVRVVLCRCRAHCNVCQHCNYMVPHPRMSSAESWDERAAHT